MISRQNLAFITMLSIAVGTSQTAIAAPEVLKQAETLLQAGQAAKAAKSLEKYLKTNPQNPEARFLHGLALARSGSTTQAIEVFYDLTQDYPELPEPYNNLAVLYAQQQEYDKARASLMAAVKTHPAYATAYENLGDIYAIHASMAYKKASKLGSTSEATKLKLDMLSRISAVELEKINEDALTTSPQAGFAPSSRPQVVVAKTVSSPAVTRTTRNVRTASAAEPIPVRRSDDVAYEQQKTAEQYGGGRVIHVYPEGHQRTEKAHAAAKQATTTAAAVAKTRRTTQAAPTPRRAAVVKSVAKPKTATTYPKLPKVQRVSLPPTATDNESRAAIKREVMAWNKALNDGNQGRYFGSYGKHFESIKGQTLSTWQRYRAAELRSQRRARTNIQSQDVELLASDLALVTLNIKTAGKRDKMVTVLLMENTLKGWKIIREEVLRKDARR